MGFFTKVFGMFDKVDDIVYEPVKAISNWMQEPLKKFQHKRDMETLQLQQQLAQEDREHIADMEISIRERHAKIDQMIIEYNDMHVEKLVDALKKYQLTLANASVEIVNNIGQMSLDLRNKAYNLVQEKSNSYYERMDEIKRKSNQELKQAKEDFGDDSELFKELSHEILLERREMIEMAERFLSELASDMKELNVTLNELTKNNINFINQVLIPIGNVIGQSNICIDANNPALENKQGFLAKGN